MVAQLAARLAAIVYALIKGGQRQSRGHPGQPKALIPLLTFC